MKSCLRVKYICLFYLYDSNIFQRIVCNCSTMHRTRYLFLLDYLASSSKCYYGLTYSNYRTRHCLPINIIVNTWSAVYDEDGKCKYVHILKREKEDLDRKKTAGNGWPLAKQTQSAYSLLLLESFTGNQAILIMPLQIHIFFL